VRIDPPYQVWPGHFSPEFCDRVMAFGDSLDVMDGSVSYDPAGKARSSEVSWVQDTPENAWIFRPIADLVALTNRRFWKWHLSGRESFQYTRYGPEQFYDWHMDARTKPYPAGKRWGGLVRKISVTITLGSPDDYEGGAFEIEDTTPVPTQAKRRVKRLDDAKRQGSAVVFPSHLHHRVCPVVSGTRRSLVAWFLGPPFV